MSDSDDDVLQGRRRPAFKVKSTTPDVDVEVEADGNVDDADAKYVGDDVFNADADVDGDEVSIPVDVLDDADADVVKEEPHVEEDLEEGDARTEGYEVDGGMSNPEVGADVDDDVDEATTDEMSKRRANSITVAEETGEAEVEIPYNAEQADERFQAEREDENRPLTPAEDLTPYTTTKEPSPPVSLAATDLDSNGDSAPEMLNDSASLLDEPKLIPLTTRDSLDSDHGDFEKVYNDEAAPAIAGIAAAIPHIAEAKSELPRAPSPASMLLPPSSKATVVEESKQRPHDESSSDIASWINNNPTLVRNVATVAAVAGVAGLGYYVYTRKMK